ncbi:putative RNA methyltransferase [Lausannevirus]|uniref:Putative RNA methyltransferase n=2 Tax=Lausannevirus TaxID=999883 RepID=A0A0N9PVK5_9VIRU|nr:putative RNA methyltransferase [Lausannevirus]AEA07082.1 putative RNA methyltransferase [Lausannevirus]ALH06905.1 putative RNA methyltransferase [Port-miou virus]
MSERLVATISAIGEFVGALVEEFPKDKALCAYDRRLQKTGVRNKTAMKKHQQEFEEFMKKYGANLTEDSFEQIPEDTKISYASETYISIGKILREIEPENRPILFDHLKAIKALVLPQAPKEGMEQVFGSVISEAKKIGKDLLDSGKIDKSKFSGKPDKKAIAEIAPLMLQEFLESGAIDRMVSQFEGKELDMGSVLGMIKNMAGEMQ